MSEEILDRLARAVADGEPEEAETLARQALEQGLDPLRCIDEGLTPGIERVGELFDTGEYFLPDLIIGGDAMKAALSVLEPALTGAQGRKILGRVVLGTVEGDLHEIGKTLVGTLLTANGFEVTDIGIDQPARAFVDAVARTGATLVGASALLTTTMLHQGEIIEALKEAGLLEGLNDLALVQHCRRQQRRGTDQGRPGPRDGIDKRPGRLVDANVGDLETVGGEQRAHQGLADLVQVALDGAQDDAPQDLAPLGAGQGRLQDREGGLHGVAADDQVGQEVFARVKQLANALDAGREPLVDAPQGVQALFQGLPGQGFRLFGLAVGHGPGQPIKNLLRHGTLLVSSPTTNWRAGQRAPGGLVCPGRLNPSYPRRVKAPAPAVRHSVCRAARPARRRAGARAGARREADPGAPAPVGGCRAAASHRAAAGDG